MVGTRAWFVGLQPPPLGELGDWGPEVLKIPAIPRSEEPQLQCCPQDWAPPVDLAG